MMNFTYSQVAAESIPQMSYDFDQNKVAGWNNILDVGKAFEIRLKDAWVCKRAVRNNVGRKHRN